ncbi:MAG: response regulator transcription factor [Flammeovirgaceae bacterium]
MRKLNILLVEDEALVREGLRALLEKEPFTKQVHEATGKEDFLSILHGYTIDMVLLDFRLGPVNGLDLITELSRLPHPPPVIVLTGLEGEELIINLLKAGVQGVLFKLDGYQEVVKAIEGVTQTGHYFSDKIHQLIQTNAHRWQQVPTVQLTFHERELLHGLAQGLTTKEIAGTLKMAEATIETYRVRLLKKLHVNNTAALLAYAYRNGVL